MNPYALRTIRNAWQAGHYRYSQHALMRRIHRKISHEEIETILLTGEIIEDYPDDKYSPSCFDLRVHRIRKDVALPSFLP